MPSYKTIIENVNKEELNDFGIKSSSRYYTGYTLFNHRYHYHKRLQYKGIKKIIQNMKYLETCITQN